MSHTPFDVKFLDESLERLYTTENNLSKLISIFGFVAVAIAIMGVYGLIIFNTRYKKKEIAIRKVNGSSIKEIIQMLNRSVLIQISIAFVLAIPVSYFFVNKWLDNFAYRSPIYWWVFLLAGCIVLFITLLTVSYQSYKAATQNPSDVLKSE